jgi:hypothetical protein
VFNKEILDCIDKLRTKETKSIGVLQVSVQYPVIEIIKMNRHQGVTIRLFYSVSDNTFDMQSPDAIYKSKISHYDFNRTERRWTMDKRDLFYFIKLLQFSGLWNMVSNKDMIIINSHNPRTNTSELMDKLDRIINGKPTKSRVEVCPKCNYQLGSNAYCPECIKKHD